MPKALESASLRHWRRPLFQMSLRICHRLRDLSSDFRVCFLINPIIDCRFLESDVAAEPKMWDAAVFDEPIHGARVALKVLGNLFQGQNLTEWISGWLSPIVTLLHDFSLFDYPHKASLSLIPTNATILTWISTLRTSWLNSSPQTECSNSSSLFASGGSLY